MKAKELFAEFGPDLSTAVNIFLRQSIRENRIPFSIQKEVPLGRTWMKNTKAIYALETMTDSGDAILSGLAAGVPGAGS